MYSNPEPQERRGPRTIKPRPTFSILGMKSVRRRLEKTGVNGRHVLPGIGPAFYWLGAGRAREFQSREAWSRYLQRRVLPGLSEVLRGPEDRL